MMAPTERSMPAVRMTSVCAAPRMPTIATCCRISVSVKAEKNLPPISTPKTTIDSDQHDQRHRRRAANAGNAGFARAAIVDARSNWATVVSLADQACFRIPAAVVRRSAASLIVSSGRSLLVLRNGGRLEAALRQQTLFACQAVKSAPALVRAWPWCRSTRRRRPACR